MEIGDYFPRVHLESIYSMKKAMNDLIVEKDLVNISGKLNDIKAYVKKIENFKIKKRLSFS